MTDGPYTFRANFGGQIVEVEMTAEDAFDYMHRGQAIGHVGDGEPFIDEDGRLGERHVTFREQQRRAQEDIRGNP
jgi:hypothetical protein